MQVRALRGVCIGVDRHLAPGDTADLEAAQVTFLVSIGAVEPLPDAPAKAKPKGKAAEPSAADPGPAPAGRSPAP
jgi:hypothetical protein